MIGDCVLLRPSLKAGRLFWLLLLLFSGGDLHPASDDENDIRRRLEAVQRQLVEVQAARDSGNAQRRAVHRELRDLETAIGGLTAEVHELDATIAALRRRLAALGQQKDEAVARLGQLHESLAAQLSTAYRMGRQSRLKMLLNIEDPGLWQRNMAYHDYFSRAYLAAIGEVDEERRRLAAIESEQRDQEARLGSELQQRSTRLAARRDAYDERRQVLARLEAALAGMAARLTELHANRADLEKLLSRLHDILADIPDDLARPFAALRGQLDWPVSAQVMRRTGSDLEPGIRLGAASEHEIRAVAHGRVAYADWLRGYGLLLIIDHGEGYLSLYGQTEALLTATGDWVDRGQPVALTGGEGNVGEPFYFELRHDGEPIDPLTWLKPR